LRVNTVKKREIKQHISAAKNIIIVGLYHDAINNKILMDYAPEGKLQLPGLKIDLNKDPFRTLQEISDRQHQIIDLFFKKTNNIFSAHSSFIFHFKNSRRITAVYLMELNTRDLTLARNSRMSFIQTDNKTWKKNNLILPDDKEIITDYLFDPEYWNISKGRTIIPVKLRP